MGLFFSSDRFTRPGPGVRPDAPRKKGVARLAEIMGRDMWNFFRAGFLAFLGCLPFIIGMFFAVETHALLFMLLTFFIGVNLNSASRWIRIPIIGMTFQPSDFMRVTLVALLAQQLAKRQKVIDKIPILPALTPGGWRKNPRKNRDILFDTTIPLLGPVVVACGAIFFSTHVLEVAEKLCDKVAIIKGGRLIRSGTMEDVKGDESLESVFLELEEETC